MQLLPRCELPESPCKQKCWTNSGGPLVNSLVLLAADSPSCGHAWQLDLRVVWGWPSACSPCPQTGAVEPLRGRGGPQIFFQQPQPLASCLSHKTQVNIYSSYVYMMHSWSESFLFKIDGSGIIISELHLGQDSETDPELTFTKICNKGCVA